MEGKPPVITACHFQFRLMQSLTIYELLIPLLHIFEFHSAQLDEEKHIVYFYSTELRNFILKILRQRGIFEAFLSTSIFMIHPYLFNEFFKFLCFRVIRKGNFRIMNLDRLWSEIGV